MNLEREGKLLWAILSVSTVLMVFAFVAAYLAAHSPNGVWP